MILFVKNIAPTTTIPELTLFIESALKSWIPFRSGKIHYARIVAYKDMHNKITENHGLVFLDDKYGRIAIKKLNRKKFNGKYVNVREYKTRAVENDRRRSINIGDETGKRVADRRRGEKLHKTERGIEVITVSAPRKQF